MQDRHLDLLLWQLRPKEGSPGSAPAATLPPPLPDPGSHQLTQQHAQPGHERDPLPLKHGSGPLAVTTFAEPGNGALIWMRNPKTPPALCSQALSAARFCLGADMVSIS